MILFFYKFLFLHLFNRNSLAGLVIFFRFEKKKSIFLLLLYVCNENSLAGLVNFFRFEKKNNVFTFSYCFYIYVIETGQMDLYIFSAYEKIIIFFHMPIVSSL